MKDGVIKNNARQFDELEMLRKVTGSLQHKHDFDQLFGDILDSAVAYTQAEGATIYMVDDADQNLLFIKVYNSRLGLLLNRQEIDWIPVPLYKDAQPNHSNLAALCYHRGQSFNFPDIYQQDVFDSSGTKTYDQANNYRTKSIVAIPMADHKKNVIGVIQLINAQNTHQEIIPFDREVISNLEMLTTISAILLNNNKLISDLQTSFNQFIKSIAWAIDRKSKHFSGHIARVTELVNTFANTINHYHEPGQKFSDIHFSQDELEEIKIAGLMHDLGKIITPMHVLDKSRKLEKIFDRIELVIHRIEHLHTLMELAELKQVYAPDHIRELRNKLHLYQEFLTKINIGGEFLDDNALALLKEIHDFSFSFQNRQYSILTDDEFYNLSIRKGTLNKEDIAVIREHAYVTGQMLSQIRFPKYMANAPLYAEQHHEKLNGSGYPQGLQDIQIPLQSRILAVSDVFEALTAVRPYKDSKKLTDTYNILTKMIDNYEIDRDLFEFALKTGIFQKYAQKYLKPEQIDTDK